jgi:predicted nucleic acid-binding protein
MQGYYEAAWSTWIVAELVRIRVEHSIAHDVPRPTYRRHVNDLVHLLSGALFIANYRDATTGGSLRDPDDEPILATAIAARAGFVVSLNTRDFPPDREALGVRYVTPGEFLELLADYHVDLALLSRPSEIGRQLP